MRSSRNIGVALLVASLQFAAQASAAPISVEDSWWYQAAETPEIWPAEMWVDDYDGSGQTDLLLREIDDTYHLILDPAAAASPAPQHLPLQILPTTADAAVSWPFPGEPLLLTHHSQQLHALGGSVGDVTTQSHFLGMPGRQLVIETSGEPVLYGFGSHVVARMPYDRVLGRFGEPSVAIASLDHAIDYHAAVLDLDVDGVQEVVNVEGAELVVLRPSADPAAPELLELHPFDDAPSRPLHVDLNGDGRTDLLYCNTAVTWVETLSTGPDLLRVQQVYLHGDRVNCAAGDLDMDGDQDVVLADSLGLSWLEAPLVPSPTNLHILAEVDLNDAVIAAGDLDGDDDPDVVVSRWSSFNDLIMYENVAAASDTWQHQTLASSFHHMGGRVLLLEDMDQDGDRDIVRSLPGWSLEEIGLVEWHENLDGAGLFAAAEQLQRTYMVYGIDLQVGSVTAPDSVDIVASAAVSTVLSRGAGGFEPVASLPAGDLRGACGYVDDSGADDELLLWVPDPYQRRLLRLRGPAAEPQRLFWSQPEAVSTNDSFGWLYCQDMDGDGLVDLLGTTTAYSNASRDDHWQLAYGDSVDPLQAPQDIFEMRDGNPTLVDLDQDGDIDVLARRGSAITWWQNPGRASTELWQEGTVTNLSSPDSVCADDFDQDGDVDVVVCGRTACYYAEHLDGQGCFAPHVNLLQENVVEHVSCGDYDGDGKADLLASVYRSQWPYSIYAGVKLYKNLGAQQVPDAGSHDALGHCFDAGAPDAGAPEAGSADANAGDSSTGLDADRADQMQADAGPGDTALTDQGQDAQIQPPDAGPGGDAANPGPDSGAADRTTAGGTDAADSDPSGDEPTPAEGCGCGGVARAATLPWLLVALALVLVRRRRHPDAKG